MALLTDLYVFLSVAGVCFISMFSLFTQGSRGNNAVEGQGSSYFFYQKNDYPRDCKEVRDSCPSSVSSGVYLIKPDGYEEPFEDYCDNDLDSGGWTVILRRFNDSLGFSRDWNVYKKGFGFLSREFWLGNDKIAYLTNQAEYELQVNLTFDNDTSCDLKYDAFRISDGWSNYTISSLGTLESNSACTWRERDNPFECYPQDSSTTFKDCDDVWNNNFNERQSGIYCIRPEGWTDLPFKARCNMSIDGGRWTVFQRRIDGSTDFYRNWEEYKVGFGEVENEYWLGNERLYYITQDLVSTANYYNKYTNFHIDGEDKKYRLTNVGTRTGTMGYSFYNIQNTPFSTYDQDNDGRGYNCAEGHRSGWWHGTHFYAYSYSYCYTFQSGNTYVLCSHANHNGDYNGGIGESLFDNHCNYKYVEMKIRRIS